jgi:molybdopterin-guanine dinucleotide biosynthesis protein A
MGQDKLVLRCHEQAPPLAGAAAAALRSTCATLFALGRPPADLKFGDDFQMIADAQPANLGGDGRLGPLAGLVAALENAQTDWLLLCAGDLPQMSASLLRALQNEAELAPTQVCFPYSASGPEPAVSAWPTALAPVLRKSFDAGRRSLQRALPPELIRAWPESSWRVFAGDSDVFRNLNTPQEWQAWCGEATVED